jgi:membrane protein YdbS with pleckstrin-like domain
VGNRALKLLVILLCCINAAMWLFYTESALMAMLWGAVAFGFFVWIIDDMRRGVPR